MPGISGLLVVEHQVLVIEDQGDLRTLISLHLREAGCRVATCSSGAQGLQRALSERWELIVLDLSLPEVDGIEICRQVRALDIYVPILMLTARSAESDRVFGLDAGADDYLTKPFGIVELVARVRAILRRVEQLRSVPSMTRGMLRTLDLKIDLDRRTVQRDGECINLTAKEFELLAFLAGHPGTVYSRAQLLDLVWSTTHDAFEHTVSSHINRLRAKLEPDPGSPRYLQTIWGVGYRFSEA